MVGSLSFSLLVNLLFSFFAIVGGAEFGPEATDFVRFNIPNASPTDFNVLLRCRVVGFGRSGTEAGTETESAGLDCFAGV